MDDAVADGTQTVTISASATGYTPGSDTVDVTDDEPPALLWTIDDGDTGYGTTGTWSHLDGSSVYGYDSDCDYKAPGDGSAVLLGPSRVCKQGRTVWP